METAAIARSETFGVFDFGLSEEQERRARLLHEGAVIVDLLCQGPCGYRAFTEPMEQEVADYLAATDDILERWNFVSESPTREALRTGDSRMLENWWHAAGVTAGTRERDFVTVADIVKGLGFFAAQVERFPWFVPATHPEHIRKAKQSRCVAGLMNSQNSVGFGTDLELLERARYLGLAMVQLTYNSANFVGSGCLERCDAGLTHFGVQFVERANDLGLIIDTSHCGPETTRDACAVSSRPIVASHTTARALHDHNRAKSDDVLKAIAATGGVIGVCAVPFFVSSEQAPSINDMLDHIDYIAQLVGWQHVAIGTDWPLQMSKSALRTIYHEGSYAGALGAGNPVDYTRNLIGFDDFRDFPNITRGLVSRGYDDEAIQGVLGENFLRAYEEVSA